MSAVSLDPRADIEAEPPASDEDSMEASPSSTRLQVIARQIPGEVEEAEIRSLVVQIRLTGQRPQQLDGKLLAVSRTVLGHDLDTSQKSEVRAAFLECLEERLGESAAGPPDEST